jgi:hypothetical protein
VNGPNVDIPAWNDALASNAALEAQAALETIVDATRWNQPNEVQAFLASRMMPDPATTSFGQALYDSRSAVASTLNSLKLALSAYLTGNNCQDPQRIQDLVDRTSDLHVAKLALAAVLVNLRQMFQSLPAPTIVIHEGVTTTNNDAWSHVVFDIELNNVAAFTDGSYQGLYDWLTHRNGDSASLVIREDMESAGIFNRPHYYPEEWNNLSVDQCSTYTSGLAQGLKSLRVRLQCEWIPHDHMMHGYLLDDFARVAFEHINMDDSN